jgi:hypothetical protein
MNGFKMSKPSESMRQNLTFIADVPERHSIQECRKHSSYIWFKQMSDRELAITDEILFEKAYEIGKLTNVPEGFEFSCGWLPNW